MVRKIGSYLVILVVFHEIYVGFFVKRFHIIVVSDDISFFYSLWSSFPCYGFDFPFDFRGISVSYVIFSNIESIQKWMLIFLCFCFVLFVVFHTSWISWSSLLSPTFLHQRSHNPSLLQPWELVSSSCHFLHHQWVFKVPYRVPGI